MAHLKRILEADLFRNSITALIVLNAIILGLLTYKELSPAPRRLLEWIDLIILGIFVIEIVLKLIVYRRDFFRSGWFVFDFIVIAASLMPGSGSTSALRALRVLRLIHVVPMMRRITEALLRAMPGMGAIAAVLSLVIYVSSVMATTLYSSSEDPEVAAMFSDLTSSAMTLFQVVTLDGWRNEVVQKVVDAGHPFAWGFFLTFIFLASFAIFNLFIALIVDALQADHEAAQDSQLEHLGEEAGEAQNEREQILKLLTELRAEVQSLKDRT